MDRAEPNNDAELLLDQTAWVQGLARSLAIDASGADDVAQEAMLAAWQARETSDRDVAGLRTWLTGVVRNLSNLRVRGETRRRVREEWVARPEPTPSAADTVSRAAQLRLVVDEVMDLDEPHRSTILMRYFDGLSTQRVADAMDCSTEAVRKRLSRALRKLRDRLDQKHGGDGASWLTALAPFLGDLPLSPWTGSLTAGLQGGGKLGISGWSALGSVAAGTALLVGGRAILSADGAEGGTLEIAGGSTPVAVVAPISLAQELSDPRERVAIPQVRMDASADSTEGEDRVVMESTLLIETTGPTQPARPRSTASGQVLDLSANPVHGVDVFVVDGASEILGTTGTDGRFDASLGFNETTEMRLVARSEGYATLRAARIQDLASHSEPIIVVAPRVDLAGQIVDETGQSLNGARITLGVSEMALHGFPYPLQETVPVERLSTTVFEGQYQLEGWPTGPGLSLQIECEGFESLELPVPAGSETERTIALARSEWSVLHGVVLHQHGEPAATAQVRLGPFSAPVDAQGLFRLEYRTVAPESVLSASSPGFIPAQVPSFGTRLAHDEATHRPVRLVLGGPARSIAGVIHDHNGQPAEGWETYAVTADAPGAQVALARMEQSPTALTAADGRFHLGGLSETDYIVHAVNRDTLVMLTSDVVRAGESPPLDFEVPQYACSNVRGRIVGRDGAPLVGARVTVVLDRAALGIDMEMLAGSSARTDGRGEFQLASVPNAFVDLRVEHPDVFSMMLDLQSAPDTSSLEFEVPRDRFIQVLDAASGAAGFEIIGEDGTPLSWVDPDGRRRRRARLRNGRSGVVRATEDARELIVYDEAGEVQEVIGLDVLERGVEHVRPTCSDSSGFDGLR